MVEFPIYGASSRSLKRKFMYAATGGRLAAESDRVVVRALEDISFDIQEGERVGLMGHNGSGKTTLLRVLAGAYEPIHGTVDVGGEVTSMLSISLGMDSESTGVENIFLRGAIMGLRRREIEGLVEGITEFAELGDYIDMPVRTYSSGMHMRLAFAISTAVPADIVLMDEWLSVGDADFAKKAEARLNDVLRKARILVLASHSEYLLESSCTRIIKLEHGRIVEDSPVEKVFAPPPPAQAPTPVPALVEPPPGPFIPFGGDYYLRSVTGANAIVATPARTFEGYGDGQLVAFVPPETNTGAVTLDISQYGAKPLFLNGQPLAAGDLPAANPVIATFQHQENRFEILPQSETADAAIHVRLAALAQQALYDLSDRALLVDADTVSNEVSGLSIFVRFVRELQDK